MRRLFITFRRFFWPLAIIITLAFLVLVFEVGRLSVYRAHPELSQAEQASAVLAKVGALIQLPTGEAPTMVSINDAASVKKAQPFLINAQNGDILIVYASASEAILYRPSTDKLIAVGPVYTTPSQQASPASSPATTSTKQATTTSKQKK